MRVCVSQGVFQLVDTAGKHNKPRQDVHNHRGGLSLCSRYQFRNTWPLTPKSYFLILFGSLTKQRQRDVSSLSSFLFCFYPFACYLSSCETDDLYTHTHTYTSVTLEFMCYPDKAAAPLSVRACWPGLWVFIEGIPWECMIPVVPNPRFLICSIPSWVMSVCHLAIWRLALTQFLYIISDGFQPLHQNIFVNGTKNSASYPQRDKCAEAQVAAGLQHTYLNIFKFVIMGKMTPPSMQICLIRNSTWSKKSLHSRLQLIWQM